MKTRVCVWDLPTRLFHWLLVLSVVGLVITGNVGGLYIEWHMRIGQFVMSLLLFRLCWGVVGGHWSRFGNFVRGPLAMWAYWRGRTAPAVGHNPLGALSVLAFLLVLAAQVTTGLLSDDEIAFFGPWAPWAGAQWSAWATSYHQTWGKFALLALIALHLLAIAVYTWVRRTPLLPAMVHGDKYLSPLTTSSSDTFARRLWALVLWALCAGVVAVVTAYPQ